MESIGEFKQTWRVASLALLILAFVGPWTYDLIYVPAKYPCNPPFVRLEGDFCGVPLSGFWIMFWLAQGFIGFLTELLTGTLSLTGRAREFLLMLLPVFLVLPLFITPLVLWRHSSRRLNALLVVTWGLAAIPGSLWLLIGLNSGLHPPLWGGWIYMGLVPLELILELLAWIVAGKEKMT